mmetsp:Transcript_31770/g.92274  ORF Transcript_31770/g.92274 Transcript_31770/m.92274 type:complete len:266 (-) Transcript_31770:1131-1928(-)
MWNRVSPASSNSESVMAVTSLMLRMPRPARIDAKFAMSSSSRPATSPGSGSFEKVMPSSSAAAAAVARAGIFATSWPMSRSLVTLRRRRIWRRRKPSSANSSSLIRAASSTVKTPALASMGPTSARSAFAKKSSSSWEICPTGPALPPFSSNMSSSTEEDVGPGIASNSRSSARTATGTAVEVISATRGCPLLNQVGSLATAASSPLLSFLRKMKKIQRQQRMAAAPIATPAPSTTGSRPSALSSSLSADVGTGEGSVEGLLVGM